MTDLRRILQAAKTVAVVGISSNPNKAAFAIPAGLQAAGYRIVPVNPSGGEILDEKAYPSLEDVPDAVDVVEVFRPAAEAPAIARSAVAIGAKVLWLQKGLMCDEARAIAEGAGLDYVEDHCMGVERSRFGIVKR